MQGFTEKVLRHADHVKGVGVHCQTEETTKQALILPLLDILGFSPFDPTRVKAEYGADFPGAKASERVDYALFCQNLPVMFIEAKAFSEKLTNHCPQLARYFNATPEVAVAAITNGCEWRFFTDLDNKNMMDHSPFLTINFADLDRSLVSRLSCFRYDEFQPGALRTLAEETVYLTAFTEAISSSLREPDVDFVRYVAARAGIQRQLNAKFIDLITPIVKVAVSKAVGEMVVTGLSIKTQQEPVSVKNDPLENPEIDDYADVVDPTNPRIVTTYAERKVFDIIQSILGADSEIVAKDTESYFSILFQGKVNRWLMRYREGKKTATVRMCVSMDDARRGEVERAGLVVGPGDNIEIPTPEHLLRISGIIFDSFAHCKNDENFKRPI